MWFLLKSFVRRLPREGFKSLSVVALAFALVFLINVMDGVKARQETQYEDIRRNYKIVVELSDESQATQGLMVEESYIKMFTETDATFSLAGYLKDVMLLRELDMSVDSLGLEGSLIGLSALEADTNLAPETTISFFDGYDGSIFGTDASVCVTSENVYVGSGGSIRLEVTASQARQKATLEIIETELTIVGTIPGVVDGVIYAPFRTVSFLGFASDGSPDYSDRLSAVISDNDLMDGFRQDARRSFTPAGLTKYALTIFDSLYFEILARIRQNISFVEVVTPVLYLLSVGIGVTASYLLTRRRLPEFATMRSIGISRLSVFLTALMEQGFLCLTGSALGFALFTLTWRYVFWKQTLMFVLCYMLGVLFSAVRAAGTNVLEILRQKE